MKAHKGDWTLDLREAFRHMKALGCSVEGMGFTSLPAQGGEDPPRETGSVLPQVKTAGDELPFPLAECPSWSPEVVRHRERGGQREHPATDTEGKGAWRKSQETVMTLRFPLC